MRVRVVDYQGNLGGGVRFTIELLKALMRSRREIRLELVSHGVALERYRSQCEMHDLKIRFLDIEPVGYWRNNPLRLFSLPGSTHITRLLGFGSKWHFEVPTSVFSECDVVWVPWIHRHRIPAGCSTKVVGSFHDVAFFQVKNLIPKSALLDERETVRQWLASRAKIILSSRAAQSVASQFFRDCGHLKVIPLSGDHLKPVGEGTIPTDWEWTKLPFLIYPANILPHKNHEVLLEGFALWGAKHPLVLTGEGTNLLPRYRGRSAALRRISKSVGLKPGETLIPLGYVSDDVYYGLLKCAWVLVVPSVAEGLGSFPVFEAMFAGVPVLCSDLAVFREQVEHTGGNVIWFDPHSPRDLAQKLCWVEQHYEQVRIQAIRQVTSLRRRLWQEVADDYYKVFDSVCKKTRTNPSEIPSALTEEGGTSHQAQVN
jgi:glycosyltransferase involved in cell wall biosynthesis